MKIRIGILGYGNLGKGIESGISTLPDMELVAVFTRREAGSFKTLTNVKVEHIDNLPAYKGKIDVLILCGGSAKDLPVQSPEALEYFNIVDSFDNHAQIPEYLAKLDEIAIKHNTLGIVSTGWDPGVFSLARALFLSVLPGADLHTFWGSGVSQGHSDAIRKIDGVMDAVQYTIPKAEAIDKVRAGKNPVLSKFDSHRRVCFVVADIQNQKLIEKQILNMPNYFEGYDVEVNFVSQDVLNDEHKKMPHGGFVLVSGKTGQGHNQLMELSLKLDSNPEFTSSVMLAYARAVYRLHKEGRNGVLTVYDVPFSYTSLKSRDELIKDLL